MRANRVIFGYLPLALILLSILNLATNAQSNNTQRFSPLERTKRFSGATAERSQRFGIQQVGEVAAEATRSSASAKPSANPVEVAINSGDKLVKQGDYDRALETFQKALSLQAHNVDALLGKGYVYIKLGDFVAAEKEFREAVTQAPKNSEALLNLGVALYRNGRIEEAITQYQKALEINSNPATLFNLAIAYSHQGQFNPAIDNYKKAIAQRNNIYPEAHNNLGLVYEAMDRFDDAAAEFNIAIQQQKGNYPLAHYNLARYYGNQIIYDKALSELLTSIKQQPNFAEGHLSLGNIYLLRSSTNNTNELPLAVKAYLKALELRNNFYPLAHENLAITYAKQGKMVEALSEYRLAVDQTDGLCPDTIANIVSTLQKKSFYLISSELGRSDNPGNLKSKRNIETIAGNTSIDKFSGKVRENLIEELGKYEELDDELKTSVDVHYSVGLAYLAIGDLGNASAELSKAVEKSHKQDAEAIKTLRSILELVLYL